MRTSQTCAYLGKEFQEERRVKAKTLRKECGKAKDRERRHRVWRAMKVFASQIKVCLRLWRTIFCWLGLCSAATRTLLSHHTHLIFWASQLLASPGFIKNGICISVFHSPCCIWVITKTKRKLLPFIYHFVFNTSQYFSIPFIL